VATCTSATGTQELTAWLNAHVNALEFYGAAPRIIVPDNVKAGVMKACWYDPELNPSYLDLARHFSLAILPTRPYHPRDKAAVEPAVQVAERWVLAPLRNHPFFSLAEANAVIAGQLRIVNNRRFRAKTFRRALFEQLERRALQPLPQTRYEVAIWKPAKVNIDYHVEYAEGYYSVLDQRCVNRSRCAPPLGWSRSSTVADASPATCVSTASVGSPPSASTCLRRIVPIWSGRR